ncbi:SDR family NAD(P)-dependent oxidoreductase [Actinoplanes subtropicus]|uniref:SDR family NAD(P)-dependent oxidoreductase n=1 Tax=Actinoplanes subtropicus TaxID=543632 RepID=UPI0004C3A631|nr:SDR family NAD(P)-dependent oxidoreductase [Actinoplanes subtropicus]
MPKIWFITGAGRGFGRQFATAALSRGDKVAATARTKSTLDDLAAQYDDALLPLELDVTNRTDVISAVNAATEAFGRLDVVVNNAGYGLFGAVEEISEQELRDQMEVNLFGAFHVTQAVLPQLRTQGSGHIIQISTIGGIAGLPNLGGYSASKWALEGLSESLAAEVAPFGINVTLIEPGLFGTDWAGSSAVHATPQPQYEPLRDAANAQIATMPPGMIGDPAAAADAILTIVDADKPPLRVLFGTLPTMMVPTLYADRLATWEAWKAVSLQANGG